MGRVVLVRVFVVGQQLVRLVVVGQQLVRVVLVRRELELIDMTMTTHSNPSTRATLRSAVVAMLLAMVAASQPHVVESAITAAGMNVILTGGGDMPPSGPLVNSGRRALYGRSVAGPRVLGEVDQVTIEFAATYHRYNACIMRTVAVGAVRRRQREMFAVTRAAIEEMTLAAAPGRPLGEIDDAHRRVFDAAGHAVHRFAACGYSLGATYRPSWMDVPPMLYSGNPMPAQPGIVLFLHAVLADADAGLAMSLGHTIVVTEDGREVLSRLPLELPQAG